MFHSYVGLLAGSHLFFFERTTSFFHFWWWTRTPDSFVTGMASPTVHELVVSFSSVWRVGNHWNGVMIPNDQDISPGELKPPNRQRCVIVSNEYVLVMFKRSCFSTMKTWASECPYVVNIFSGCNPQSQPDITWREHLQEPHPPPCVPSNVMVSCQCPQKPIEWNLPRGPYYYVEICLNGKITESYRIIQHPWICMFFFGDTNVHG